MCGQQGLIPVPEKMKKGRKKVKWDATKHNGIVQSPINKGNCLMWAHGRCLRKKLRPKLTWKVIKLCGSHKFSLVSPPIASLPKTLAPSPLGTLRSMNECEASRIDLWFKKSTEKLSLSLIFLLPCASRCCGDSLFLFSLYVSPYLELLGFFYRQCKIYPLWCRFYLIVCWQWQCGTMPPIIKLIANVLVIFLIVMLFIILKLILRRNLFLTVRAYKLLSTTEYT